MVISGFYKKIGSPGWSVLPEAASRRPGWPEYQAAAQQPEGGQTGRPVVTVISNVRCDLRSWK